MQSRPIRFFHRGSVVEVDGAAPTRTVLEWLREDARCTGSKEGCNEGDCGACTVVIGELAGEHGGGPGVVDGLRLTTTNACLQFLPVLDGKALFTVEDLRGADGRLHPAQQAMVECHGSQCGFCTPGFVMSLWSMYQQGLASPTRPSRQQVADELSGNLCRCTGYRPILDAGERMFELPPEPLDAAPVVAALQTIRVVETFRYAAGGAEFVAPRTLDAFADERFDRPNARILSGSTDVGLWVNKQFRELPELLYIGGVDELKRIETHGDMLSIGAGASLEAAWQALVARWPSLADVWLRFAGPPLRNSGTMGGNVANGSPIGDSAPVLMALDARLVLRHGKRLRRLSLAKFYNGYMTNDLAAGEFVQAIEVPLTGRAEVRAYKISKRFDCDISAVCAGLAVELDGNAVKTVRLAFGGMAATVRRAAKAETAVVGQSWTDATLSAAQQALADDFAPLTDMRAGAAYRLQVAQNLLKRFWLETRTTDRLDGSATSVWNAMPHVLPARLEVASP